MIHTVCLVTEPAQRTALNYPGTVQYQVSGISCMQVAYDTGNTVIISITHNVLCFRLYTAVQGISQDKSCV